MCVIEDLEFKGSWRSYQQRVLDELEVHLGDKKLNVVAAPGAGKTTLGIEVLLRLGFPALILAPTITIRNQWKQRILEGFLPEDYDKTKISTDIKNIEEITVSTYQALHTIYKIPEEKEKFLNALKKNNIKTLVLDEAHHLRTEWYLTLDKLCEYLEDTDFTTVSLTGTPPYDVSPEEWNNYHSLCGPVDAEISIPELVKNNDLCPHQDLIYFSDLSAEEEKTVYDFEKNRSEFFRYINNQADFQHAVEMSDFVQQHLPDVIFKNTGFTLSVISYLLSADSLSIPAKIMMEFLELEPNMIPSFDYDIAKTLIDGILGSYEPYFENSHVIKNKLRELKLLNGNKADLKGEVDFKKLFARSVNKLDAIKDITAFEYSLLNEKLREVILLDYIGKGDTIGLNIFSVFDNLYENKIPLGILTGTLIVIPQTAKEELYKILEERKIDLSKVLTTEFKKDYLRVETYGEVNIVSVITELFEKGKINVLIGTAALLGEGWDSPCVNTLIIASVVGSFMLSNQMRGRALRIDKNNPEKSSNIWHLVSLTSYEGVESPDFLTVIKRFNTFEGISYKDNQIQNGIERLGKTFKEFESSDCKILNEKMFEYAKDRENLKNKWEQVFNKSKINEKNMISQMYEIIETDTHLPQVIENENFVQRFISDYRNRQKVEYTKFEQLKIAQCILKTLCDIDVIKTNPRDISLQADKTDDGKFSITVVGCTSNERNIFVKSFCEVFAFDDSTRYILKITRTVKEKAPVEADYDSIIPKFKHKTIEREVVKYLPVPDIIGTQQKFVKIFTKNLKGEHVEKGKQVLANPEESCLKPATPYETVYFIHENKKMKLLIEEFIDLIRCDLKSFNKNGILKKSYSDIEIRAYRKDAQNLISFFNCSDYERNIIINNLCEIYLNAKGWAKAKKIKEDDGITYLVIPDNVRIHSSYPQNRNYVTKYDRNGSLYKLPKNPYIIPQSMKVSGVISSLVSTVISYFVTINLCGGYFDIIIFIFLLPFIVTGIFIFSLIPIDYTVISIKNLKRGNYKYSRKDYTDKNLSTSSFSREASLAEFYKLIIMIIDLLIILPYKNYLKKDKKITESFSIKRLISNTISKIRYSVEFYEYKLKNDLSKNAKIDMIYTKSSKNRGEVLKARYNAWLKADISRSRKWI